MGTVWKGAVSDQVGCGMSRNSQIYSELRGLATAPDLGRGGALSLDVLKQHTGRFVFRVLRHQFTAESFSQNALGQVVDAAFSQDNFRFHLLGKGKELFDAADNFALLNKRWKRYF